MLYKDWILIDNNYELYEILLKNLDPDKNNDLDLDTITHGSRKKVYLRCSECGRRWEKAFEKAILYPNCNCLRRKNKLKKNSLSFLEWSKTTEQGKLIYNYIDFEANNKNGVDLNKISYGSNKKVYFKCQKCNNEWYKVAQMARKIKGCPFCEVPSSKLSEGLNDLKSWCEKEETGIGEYILEHWDYKKNSEQGIYMNKIRYSSNQRVYTCCDKHGEYESYVTNLLKGRRCRKCNVRGTSVIEQTLYLYLKDIFNEVYHRELFDNHEADIYIKDLNLVVEYNGFWHNNRKNSDNNKLTYFLDNGYNVLWINDSDVVYDGDFKEIIYYNYRKEEDVDVLFEKLINYLNNRFSLNLEFNSVKNEIRKSAYEGAKDVPYEKSIAYFCEQYPNFSYLDEWDYEKNSSLGLTPENIFAGSAMTIYCKCDKCGAKWEYTPQRFLNRKTHCPCCIGHMIIYGINDLETWCIKNNRYDISNSWVADKNEKSIREVYYNSDSKYYFDIDGYPKLLSPYSILKRKGPAAKVKHLKVIFPFGDELEFNSQRKCIAYMRSNYGIYRSTIENLVNTGDVFDISMSKDYKNLSHLNGLRIEEIK